MKENKLIAGESIKKGQLTVIREDGLLYRHETEIQFWETLGFSSYKEAIQEITRRVPEIVAYGEHNHYKK